VFELNELRQRCPQAFILPAKLFSRLPTTINQNKHEKTTQLTTTKSASVLSAHE